MKKPDEQKIVRQLSSRLIEKYNGFTVIRIEYDKKERKNFEQLDIIYKPTKKLEIEPLNHIFSIDISQAYSAYYSSGSWMHRAQKVKQCHYCNHFFVHNPQKFERHLKQCSRKPGVIYNFTNQSSVSYKDNFKTKGDLPFCVYFDFETTAPTDTCLDPEQKKMSVVSHVMIVAFHPALNLERVIIYRSFAHMLDQLSNIDYLSREQISFIDNYLIHMLKDCARDVAKRQCKNSLGQMFSVESALVKKTLLKWFNAKFKRTFSCIKPITKLRFESENKINWQTDKCVLCKFPIKLQPTNSQTPSSAMTYGDFIIRFEHTFLRNIYSEEQLLSAGHTKTLQNYYDIFQKYIQIFVGLLALLNRNQRTNFINDEIEEFVDEEFPDEKIQEIKNAINKTEIKNALSQSHGEVYKFNLKVYAFVYDKIIFLPLSDIKYDTVPTDKFFIHVHRLIKGKIHLHHSHMTGEILGYSHDFCNTSVIEKTRSEILFVAHNFFGFDVFYFLKTYIASSWCSKKLNIGGTNLTHVNYGIINNEIKLTDSLRYYQKGLADLSSTLTKDENKTAEKLTRKFYYFSTVWPYLTQKLQEKVLDIITGGKGIIPYELIVDMNSLLLTPDDEQFWSKTEFFSELKTSDCRRGIV